MINPNLFLVYDFSTQKKLSPIRKGFGMGLVEAGKKNEDVVALCCDLTESTQMHLFKDTFPKRFIEVGIAEQSMASVASGMAAMGKIPFFSSYAMFSPGRNWEQIRTTICYNNSNCKIVGSHAGVSVGPDGGTHQAIEDIAIVRVIPRMTVVVPCDAEQARKATLALAEMTGPAYIRLQREDTPLITSSETPFEIGKVQVLFDTGKSTKHIYDVLISVCGGVTAQALDAAHALAQDGYAIRVVNVHTIKPLDTMLVQFAKESTSVVTIEEHQRIGGLGGAVAELISEHAPKKVLRIGINDEFGQSGTPNELLKHYKLDAESIAVSIRAMLKEYDN
ncbi:MAG: transketolase C-terminal domain-containing protein [Alphaproteobacteria bacterium]|nr:transketolase C-terminal domain-containing protein [Alphaproteobacteria bacterium]